MILSHQQTRTVRNGPAVERQQYIAMRMRDGTAKVAGENYGESESKNHGDRSRQRLWMPKLVLLRATAIPSHNAAITKIKMCFHRARPRHPSVLVIPPISRNSKLGLRGQTRLPKLESHSKSCGKERNEIVFGSLPFNHGCHYVCGDGSEKDAVAEVAGSDVITGRCGRAEDGQGIWSSVTQARPIFEDFAVAELGDQIESDAMEALHGGNIGAFVESSLFHGGAHKEASVATRDQIHLWRTDHMVEQGSRGHQQTQHLSFYRARGKDARRDLARPCSGTVDDFVRVECSLDGSDSGGAAMRSGDGGDFAGGREVNTATLRGFPGSGAERSGIDAAFFQIEGRPLGICQRGLQFSQGSGQQAGKGESRPLVDIPRRRKHNSPMIAQIDVHARFELELVHIPGIQARAGGGKRLEDGRSLEATVDQHAAGGV